MCPSNSHEKCGSIAYRREPPFFWSPFLDAHYGLRRIINQMLCDCVGFVCCIAKNQFWKLSFSLSWNAQFLVYTIFFRYNSCSSFARNSLVNSIRFHLLKYIKYVCNIKLRLNGGASYAQTTTIVAVFYERVFGE